MIMIFENRVTFYLKLVLIAEMSEILYLPNYQSKIFYNYASYIIVNDGNNNNKIRFSVEKTHLWIEW